MLKLTLSCPSCGYHAIVKNGKTRHSQQNYKCNDCGRQFVENPKWRRISEETKKLIERLLLEKIPLAGIARSLEISEPWLQNYVNQKYESVPTRVKIQAKKREISNSM